jgi:hypothetical protein
MRFIFAFLLFLTSTRVLAQHNQTVKGGITDSAGHLLQDVLMLISNGARTDSVNTNISGSFTFRHLDAGTYTLLASYRDLVLHSDTLHVLGGADTLLLIPTIVIKHLPSLLEEVIVRPPPVTVKEDTIQFNAAAYRMREGAMVEELVKKFPGLNVDKDGNLTAQGKPIVKIRVNGKDFFAGDIQTALQNLPVDIVRNIQIIDDYGEQANLTGIKSGEAQKVININLQKDKNKGVLGTVTAGVGTEDRYLANLSLNRFKGDQQISLVATANNTNLNVTAIGSGRAASAAGQGASNTGITRASSLGANYRNNLGKKLIVYGSYSFSARDNNNENLLYQLDLNPLNARTTSRNSTNSSRSQNHRLNWNLEYALSPLSFFKISGSGSYTGSNSATDAVSSISRTRFFTNSRSTGTSESENAGTAANAIFNRRFARKGRNLNVAATFDYSVPAQRNRINNLLTDVDSAGIDSSFQVPLIAIKEQRQRQEGDNTTLHSGLNMSYAEPLSEQLTAELNYSVSYDRTMNRRQVYDLDTGTDVELINTGLGNDYQSSFLTSRYGLNIQSRHKKYNYLLGIILQPSELKGVNNTRAQVIQYSTTSWLPTARLSYRFSSSQTLTVNYNGVYREPEFQKLQPIVDSTNPSNILIGNPALRPEFTNRLSLSFNSSDKESGRALFSNLSYDKTLNKIINSVYNDKRSTSSTTTYVNDDGFHRVSGNATITQPFSDRRFIVSVGVLGSFDNNISYTDNQRNNGQSWTIQPNARMQLALPDVLDVELNASYGLNRTEAVYAVQRVSTNTRAFMFGISGRSFFFKDLTLGYDYSKAINLGFGGATNFNPDILNLYLEYRFLSRKSATIRLQGFDLLSQNTRIGRTVSGTTITDSKTNGLQRYFLLTFGWRLNRFG